MKKDMRKTISAKSGSRIGGRHTAKRRKKRRRFRLKKGINLIGYSRAETGVGESCRAAARSIHASSISFRILPVSDSSHLRMRDLSWSHKEIKKPQYRVNLLYVNANGMNMVRRKFGKELFRDRYSIGVWHWELPDFPDEYSKSFRIVDELWAPSTYIQQSLLHKSPVPVILMPHSIEVSCPLSLSRLQFGLPEDRFLFMTMYDTRSFRERKNPEAAIEAFKRAFGPNDGNVGLVLKINHSFASPQDNLQLHRLIDGYENIMIVDATLGRYETNALLQNIDCLVSLHRAEGFGLGLAEAMYLEKPVIGTNWSANTDFMNAENSCPVQYELVRIGRDIGPYKAEQFWAEPDIEHAAHYMKKLVSDSDWLRTVAWNGRHTIRTDYAPAVIGRRMKRRLKRLKLL